MPSWLRSRRNSQNSPAAERLIHVSVVSRDAVLVEEVHQHLMVGFSTRGGYDFQAAHPDFQQFSDVLFVDLRAAGVQAEPSEGLAFIDTIRASVSHPPIVVLCDTDAAEFKREVIRRGAYDALSGPLNGPHLRLGLQRAYECRLAETKLESFVTQQAAAKERPPALPNRRMRILPTRPRPVMEAGRAAYRATRQAVPSRLAVGFVLGCVLFFAGLVAVRTILTGMGDTLASAGFAADSGAGAPDTSAVAPASQSGAFAARLIRPLAATTDFSHDAFDANSPRPFRAGAELAARPHSSLPGYEPAALIERVTPRYSPEARSKRLKGTVQIRALIAADGTPRGLARVSGDPTLAQIAIDAIALWRYAPATLDGEPVESEVIIPVDFQLPD